MTLFTLAEKKEAFLEIKKSKFIGLIESCSSLENFKKRVLELKKEHPKAAHVCSATRLGLPPSPPSSYFDDDGEPTGSAGRPILAHLEGGHFIQTAVYVVRYFGGIKLGVGGLVSAYSDITRESLLDVIKIPFIEKVDIKVKVNYPILDSFLYEIKKENIFIKNQEYLEVIFFTLEVTKEQIFFIEKLSQGRFFQQLFILS